ncbi:MAG TPA: hypothetical protein VE487_08395 [Ilumatobacter sp.]|jgi:hypothetical protein|nr:hypothetical protein [Ilumatobacter sp.]
MPAEVRSPMAMLGFMLLLAGLDFAGTMLAKEWTIHRAAWQLLGGGFAFVALFVALVSGLRYAEMSMLSLGWIVVLQTGLILLDRSRYGFQLSTGGWFAVAAILVLQGYLLIGGGSNAAAPADDGVGQSSAASAAS